MLVLLVVAADWTAWYETQVKLRSAPPKTEHARWMQAAAAECHDGDTTACAYILTFRTFDLQALIEAADTVTQKCADGDHDTCEAALKVAKTFPIVFYNHRFGLMRDRFPQDIFQAVCLRFGAYCGEFDMKACREDKRCALSEEQTMLIELRQGQELAITPAAVRAIAKDCGDGVVNCRPKDMTFYRRDCPSGGGCFVAAYDGFLRAQDETKETEMYAAIAGAGKDTPANWLTDAKTAQCLRGKLCDAKGKLVDDLKRFDAQAVGALNVYLYPATAIVLNELVEAKVEGNPKLAGAMAELEVKRSDFQTARKAKARETMKPQFPSPRTATQSAMFAFIQERESAIADSVRRYE